MEEKKNSLPQAKKSLYFNRMTNDFNTISEENVTVRGIRFYYTSKPSAIKGCLDLTIRDEKGNARTMMWSPRDETVEEKINLILESKRWP